MGGAELRLRSPSDHYLDRRFASMGSGFGGMIFSIVTGRMVDRYSFSPTFVLFGILPLIAAGMVWTLPTHSDV